MFSAKKLRETIEWERIEITSRKLGTFHAKMGTGKDRNGMDLTEAEGIKKRWQEYTEELYKNDLNDPGNHDGMITHLEPDRVQSQVGLRKHPLSLVEVIEFQLSYFKS